MGEPVPVHQLCSRSVTHVHVHVHVRDADAVDVDVAARVHAHVTRLGCPIASAIVGVASV